MKRELKLFRLHEDQLTREPNCRAYPDEKGIETQLRPDEGGEVHSCIAEPIPMKRELKLDQGVMIDSIAR